MKRIKAACLCQTMHFQLSPNMDHGIAVKAVQEEVKNYKTKLVQNRTLHKILSEETQPDGSVILKLIKQYNSSPVGDYLD